MKTYLRKYVILFSSKNLHILNNKPKYCVCVCALKRKKKDLNFLVGEMCDVVELITHVVIMQMLVNGASSLMLEFPGEDVNTGRHRHTYILLIFR